MWIDLINKLFKKKRQPEVITGQVYILKNDIGNPFHKSLIYVLEVKSGFVRYSYHSPENNNVSCNIKLFLFTYVLYKDINHNDSFIR